MSNFVYGWQAKLLIDNSVNGFARSGDLTINGENFETTTFANEGWVNRDPGGLLDATYSTEMLVSNPQTGVIDFMYLMEAKMNRQKVVLEIKPNDVSTIKYFTGTFVIDDVQLPMEVKSQTVFNVGFSIDGSLSVINNS